MLKKCPGCPKLVQGEKCELLQRSIFRPKTQAKDLLFSPIPCFPYFGSPTAYHHIFVKFNRIFKICCRRLLRKRSGENSFCQNIDRCFSNSQGLVSCDSLCLNISALVEISHTYSPRPSYSFVLLNIWSLDHHKLKRKTDQFG